MSKPEDKKPSDQPEKKLSLNLNAKAYIPKSNYASNLSKSYLGQSAIYHPQGSMMGAQPKKSTPLSLHDSQIKLSNSKPFFPKGYNKSHLSDLKTKKQIVKDTYLLVDEDDKGKKPLVTFDLEYMMAFENWKISKETKLFTKELLQHIENFKIVEEEIPKLGKDNYRKDKYNKRDNYKRDRDNKDTKSSYKKDDFKRSENPTPVTDSMSMEQWGRKDITKELELAEKFKQQIEELKAKDPMKFELTEYLNMLTVDNYDEVSENIYKKIEPDVEFQKKFLDVLFKKAVNEKAFVFLYARLCKEFDKKLPQKNKPQNSTKKPTSAMRSILLDKCREIFKIENNEKLDHYIKVNDPDEREFKLKKFVLGNVNFIGELINIQVLSKKIVFQCIENLFKRYENEKGDEVLRLINLEAIVILMDKFGTLLKKKEDKIKKEDMEFFTNKINECIDKLDVIQKEAKLPGHIKYKIINLIEKKKDGWAESKFQKASVAKSKEEVRKEFEESQKPFTPAPNQTDDENKYSQEEVNDKIRSDLSNWKEFIEDDGKVKDYDWSVVEDIYSDKKNTLAEILTAFVENCIDFVQKPQHLPFATDYFKELYSFYSKTASKDEKFEIATQAIELLKNASDMALDNKLMYDLWGYIIFYLMKFDIVKYKDFDRMHDLSSLSQEQIEGIFTIFNKAVENDSGLKNQFLKAKITKDNSVLFNKIVVSKEK